MIRIIDNAFIRIFAIVKRRAAICNKTGIAP